MNRLFLIGLIGILLTVQGWADIDLDAEDLGSEQINKPVKRRPFSFGSHIDAIGTTKINRGYFKGDKIQFATAEVEAGMVVYYCPTYTEGVRLSLGYSPTYLNWSECPWFDQNRFNLVNLDITGFSKRLDDWFWRTQLSVNFDADHWDADYISYDLLLWGRYSCCSNVGLHFGFWAETGLQMDRVYPIIGLDWTISPKWKLNLVFPVNVALEYSVTQSWKLALAGRFFDARFRVNKEECTSKSLVRYTNVGAEFAIKYDNDVMSANIHIGTTLAGKFRQATKDNHHAHTFHLDPAAYVGGEIDVKF